MLNRRTLLASGLAGMVMTASFPGAAWAVAGTNKRFIFIIQRGAADGLATLAPTGDPDFARARGDASADGSTGHRLDSFFTLHAAMPQAARMFAQGEASFSHALASGYRERSHFDAQNMLESGAAKPYGRSDGWIGRLLAMLPTEAGKAVAVAPAVPLALRGPIVANSYAPSRLPNASSELMVRLSTLYAEDAQLSGLWEGAMATDAMAGTMASEALRGGAALGKVAAGLMAGATGAQVVMLETNGWDTHFQQEGRLTAGLRQLDALIASLREGLALDWDDTLVMVATEFGRTVAFNGTGGTDHGTGSSAMLFGGRLEQGGRVKADWPGLANSNLLDGRDLRPTSRFEDFASTALAHHYGMDRFETRKALFPDFALLP
ncbi:MAG: DUF1501 domain-containing protein [Sphingorhabdus sp.]